MAKWTNTAEKAMIEAQKINDENNNIWAQKRI